MPSEGEGGRNNKKGTLKMKRGQRTSTTSFHQREKFSVTNPLKICRPHGVNRGEVPCPVRKSKERTKNVLTLKVQGGQLPPAPSLNKGM